MYCPAQMPTLREVEVDSAEVISRDIFPVGGKIDNAHVKLVYGLATKSWQDSDFRTACDAVEKKRSNAASWGKAKLQAMILEAAREWGIKAYNWDELKNGFKKDPSSDFAARLWESLYGTFDRRKRWEYDLETEYMDFAGMEYDAREDGTSGKKGCIARLFVNVRKELVKAVNHAGKKNHGGVIRMKRTSEEVKKSGKGKRRKMGQTLCSFYNMEITNATKPSDLIHNSPRTPTKKKSATKSPAKKKSATKSPKKKKKSPRRTLPLHDDSDDSSDSTESEPPLSMKIRQKVRSFYHTVLRLTSLTLNFL